MELYYTVMFVSFHTQSGSKGGGGGLGGNLLGGMTKTTAKLLTKDTGVKFK